MHSRIFVINETEITEEELYESIHICDYVVEETEEEKRDSIDWLRRVYLGQSGDDDFFSEKEIDKIREKIVENTKARLSKIQDKIAEIKIGKEDYMWGLWEIKELAYPQSEFFFVTEDGLLNEPEFYNFLKSREVKEFRVTKTYDYHY